MTKRKIMQLGYYKRLIHFVFFNEAIQGSYIVHCIQHNRFYNRAQAAGAKFQLYSLICEVVYYILIEDKVHAFQFQQLLVLPHKGVLGLCKYLLQSCFIQWIEIS